MKRGKNLQNLDIKVFEFADIEFKFEKLNQYGRLAKILKLANIRFLSSSLMNLILFRKSKQNDGFNLENMM